MSQVAALLGGESAFFGTQFQLSVSQSLKNLTEVVEVFFPGGGELYSSRTADQRCRSADPVLIVLSYCKA